MNLMAGSENPTTYNLWCGISVIASTMKRNAFIWYHSVKVFPNQYIILIGPPGIGKGSAIIPATNLAKEAGTVNYLSDSITAEKIIERIADGYIHPVIAQQGGAVIGALAVKEHTACLLAEELPVLLRSSDWMHEFLCAIWSKYEYDYQTKNKSSKFIKDMCVSILGGCVPDYIRKLTKDTMAPVTGGFTARCIFVYATKKSQLLTEHFGSPNGSRSQLEHELIEDLKHISRLQGEVFLTDEAKILWHSMYSSYAGGANSNSDFESDALINFKSRVPSHVLKCALALCFSEGDTFRINERQLSDAIKLVEDVRDNVDVTFRAVGESPLAVGQERIMKFIESRGITSYKEILKFNNRHVTPDQLSVIINLLETIGFCEVKHQGASGHQLIEHWSKFATQWP
jgi:hypothetical protein